MRAVIRVKKDADIPALLAYLYKYTDLEVTFGINMVVIADGKPQQLRLMEIIRLTSNISSRLSCAVLCSICTRRNSGAISSKG